jgi:asparagine synthase (glutamine-hydrolysing)
MPGLVGAVGKGAGIPEMVKKMTAGIGFSPVPDPPYLLGTAEAYMGHDSSPRGPGGSKVSVGSDGTIVGFDGEVLGIEGGVAEVSGLPGRSTGTLPAEALLRIYRSHGIGIVPLLRGAFALAIWDAHSKSLHLAADRHALRPLYYMQCGERTLFGSSVRAILAGAGTIPEKDEQGIDEFLLLGFPQGVRTFFEGVSLVAPATIVSIQDGRVSRQQYWHLKFCPKVVTGERLAQAARRFGEAFDAAMEECTVSTGTLELPLSGGLDSRCLAVAVAALQRPARTCTIGSKDSRDLQTGPRVAGLLGLPSRSWTIGGHDFMEWIPASVYLTDGMYNPIHSPILAIARRLPPDASIVLDGTSSLDSYTRLFDLPAACAEASRRMLLAQALHICADPLVRAAGGLHADVLHPDRARTAQRGIRATLEELVDSIPPDQRRDPFAAIDFLDQSNRIRRHNMMGTVLLRAYCEVRHPFFDTRVVNVVTSFGSLYRSAEKLVIGRYLAARSPAVASVPYERTGLRADATIAEHLLNYAGRAARRGLGHVIPSLREKRRVAIDFGMMLRSDEQLRSRIRDILYDPRTMGRGYYEPAAARRSVEECISGRAANLPFVGRMLSLELWHRFFLEGETPPAKLVQPGLDPA